MLRERPAGHSVLASVVAFAGVMLMVGLGREGSLFGDFLAFCMTLCMAVMMVMARRFRAVPVMQAACLSALLSGLVCWPFGQAVVPSGGAIWLLIPFGLVNSALGLTLFTLGARLLPAIETALIGALDAPLAPLWVWLAFGEMPGMGTLAGGAVGFGVVAVHIWLSSGAVSPR